MYLRYGVLKAKDFKPDPAKASNVLDLRPAVIAKLQQVIKDASNGLYILSIDNLEPDVLASKIHLLHGSIKVDSVAMHRLDELKKLPEDIFFIQFDSLQIDGLGLNDLLHKDKMDIKSIYLDHALIHIYRKTKPYNNNQREDSMTLYKRLMGQWKKLAIAAIDIRHSTLIVHNQNDGHKEPNRFNDIALHMSDVLIDSTTQYDHKRFLFARHATVHTTNYSFVTNDKLYIIKLGDITLSGEDHKATLLNAELKPNGNKQEFEKKLKQRDEMFDITFPRITLNDVNWWQLVNKEKIISRYVAIHGGTISVYVDKALPLGAPLPIKRYPHQLVMDIPVPVLVNQLQINDVKVVYRQFTPATGKIAGTDFTHVNGVIRHITNIPAEMKKEPYTYLTGTGSFMSQAPLHLSIKFNLAKYQTGAFTAIIWMDTLNKETVNPVAEPIGSFFIKRGQMQKATIQVNGDNSSTHSRITFLYNDLHITPLHSDSTSGNQKKNHVKSFFANIIFIKNQNPEGTDLRQPAYDLARGPHENFVAFMWMSIMTGICKTIGIPVRLVMKDR
jgi:hypothetical protein